LPSEQTFLPHLPIANRRQWEVSVFSVEHYIARASELEAAAKAVVDLNIKTTYLELGGAYRAMADRAAKPCQTIDDDEAVKLAERMVGRGRSAE
jgi:hypothetical protein